MKRAVLAPASLFPRKLSCRVLLNASRPAALRLPTLRCGEEEWEDEAGTRDRAEGAEEGEAGETDRGNPDTEDAVHDLTRGDTRHDLRFIDEGGLSGGSEEREGTEHKSELKTRHGEGETASLRRHNAFLSEPARLYEVDERDVFLSMSQFSSNPSRSSLGSPTSSPPFSSSSSFSLSSSSLYSLPSLAASSGAHPHPADFAPSSASTASWRGRDFASGRGVSSSTRPPSSTARPACGFSHHPGTEKESSRRQGTFRDRGPGEGRGVWPLFSSLEGQEEPSDESEAASATPESEGTGGLKREGDGQEDQQKKSRESGWRRKDDEHDHEERCEKRLHGSDQKEEKKDADVARKSEPELGEERNLARETFQEVAASAASSILIRTLLFRGDALSVGTRAQIVQSLLRIAQAASPAPVSPDEPVARPKPALWYQMLDEDVVPALLPFLLSDSEQESLSLAALRSDGRNAPPPLWRRWMWRTAEGEKRDFPERRKAGLQGPPESAGRNGAGRAELTKDVHARTRGDAEEQGREALLRQLRTQQRDARKSALLLIHLLAKEIPHAVNTHARAPALMAVLARLQGKRAEERDVLDRAQRERTHRSRSNSEEEATGQVGKAPVSVRLGPAERRSPVAFASPSPAAPCDTLSTAEEGTCGDDASNLGSSPPRFSPSPSLLPLGAHTAPASFADRRAGERDERTEAESADGEGDREEDREEGRGERETAHVEAGGGTGGEAEAKVDAQEGKVELRTRAGETRRGDTGGARETEGRDAETDRETRLAAEAEEGEENAASESQDGQVTEPKGSTTREKAGEPTEPERENGENRVEVPEAAPPRRTREEKDMAEQRSSQKVRTRVAGGAHSRARREEEAAERSDLPSSSPRSPSSSAPPDGTDAGEEPLGARSTSRAPDCHRASRGAFFSRLLGLSQQDKQGPREASSPPAGEAKGEGTPADSPLSSSPSPAKRVANDSPEGEEGERPQRQSAPLSSAGHGACGSFSEKAARERSPRVLWIPVLLSANPEQETEIVQTSVGAADPHGKLLDSLRARLAERRKRDKREEEREERETEQEEARAEDTVEGEEKKEERYGARDWGPDREGPATVTSEEEREEQDMSETHGLGEFAPLTEKPAKAQRATRPLRSLGSETKKDSPTENSAEADLADILHDRSFFVTEGGIGISQEERKGGRTTSARAGDDEWGLLGVYFPAHQETDAPSSLSSSPLEIVALFRGPDLVRSVARFVSPSCPLLRGEEQDFSKRERERELKRAEKLLRIEGLRLLLSGAQSTHEEVRSRSLHTLLRILTGRWSHVALTADELARTAGSWPAKEGRNACPETETREARDGARGTAEPLPKQRDESGEKSDREKRRGERKALVDLLVSALWASVQTRHNTARGAARTLSLSAWEEQGEAAGLEMLYVLCVLSADWLNILQTHTGLYVLLCALSRDLRGVVKLPRPAPPSSPFSFSVAPPVLRHARAPARVARRLRFLSVLRAVLGFHSVPDPACGSPARGLSPAGRKRGLRILCFDGGGTRGVLSIALLKQIVACVGREVHETFDIICGTSTGGVIAALLGLEKATVTETERLYDLLIREIFVRDSAAVTGARLVLRQALYNEKGWEGILEKAWGRRRMVDFAADPTCPKVFCVSTVASPNPTQVMVWRNYNFPVELVKAEHPPGAREEPQGKAAAGPAARSAGRPSEKGLGAFFARWWSTGGTEAGEVPAGSEGNGGGPTKRVPASPHSGFSRFMQFFRPPRKSPLPRSRAGPNPWSAPLPSPTSFLLVPSRGSRHAGSSRILVKDALRATTAAPGFFSGIFWEGQAFSDGALLANNPTAVALAEARGLYGADVPIDLVVSIGTGKFPSSFSSPSRGDSLKHLEQTPPAEAPEKDAAGGWSALLGLGGWETLLAQLANCATNTEAVHDLLADLLPPSVYFRFNPDIGGNWSIDETRSEKLDVLKGLAERFFLDNPETRRRLAELVSKLRETRDDEEGDERGLAGVGESVKGEGDQETEDEWEDVGAMMEEREEGEDHTGTRDGLPSGRRKPHARSGIWNSFLTAISPREPQAGRDKEGDVSEGGGDCGKAEGNARGAEEGGRSAVREGSKETLEGEGDGSLERVRERTRDIQASNPPTQLNAHERQSTPFAVTFPPTRSSLGESPLTSSAGRSSASSESSTGQQRSLWSWLAGKRSARASSGAGASVSTPEGQGVTFSFAEKVLDVLSARSEHQELHRQAFISARGATRLPQSPASSRSVSLHDYGPPATREDGARRRGRRTGDTETARRGAGDAEREDEAEEYLVPPTGVQVVLQTIHTHLEEEIEAAEKAREERRRMQLAERAELDTAEMQRREALATNQESHLREEQAMLHEAAMESRRSPSQGSVRGV
ncbi:hypothetical protein NCLIV_031630 [Neospora caninum Liverpool]|uniref:PNPLA domain-containing protein n=1 Tax=Neospora caninum (strain Liverpool) TaxID=572307 RepID=F0VI15_NEOCL|nr:hypothetical protein NCLIV_031630 [Neospora caninum Liverpool]CBZ53376.1 hypothetical protein NCLIV_031630 [Neospora caninum Liverpool]|eukprot:XP_003883408.1 hypothetical protein NCLIV_031630 [Neospora caninum Liverpool]